MTAQPSSQAEREDVVNRFWLIVRESGKVPDRKGPWPHREVAKVMREFIAARPTAFIDVLTIGCDGTPDVAHGPEVLQMVDGRSMSVASRHNDRVRAAAHAALSDREHATPRSMPEEVVEASQADGGAR